MTLFKRTWPIAREYIRLSFLNMMNFRIRYYTGVLTYLIYVSVYWFIWQAAFAGRETIGGLTSAQMTTYIAVGWVARIFYYNDVDWDLNGKIKSGAIASELTRPVHPLAAHFFYTLGEALFRLLFFGLPTAIVMSLVYDLSLPYSFVHGVLFIAFNILALALSFLINFMVGISAFFTESALGLMRLKYVGLQILTGLLIPVSFFPSAVAKILYMTPFPYMAEVPLKVYMGLVNTTEIIAAATIMMTWIAALMIGCIMFWQLCFKKLVIQGG